MITLKNILGLFVFILIAWGISENRDKVSVKTILIGVGLQFIIAVIFLKSAVFTNFFVLLNRAILAIESATEAGTALVFGYVGGGPFPFEVTNISATIVLGIQKLPIILIMSALSALLFYWKILPLIVKAFSWLLQKTVGLGGAEGVGLSANIFVGMVEAPLLVRPYLSKMTRSELFCLMTCGMATIAGTVLALYASILKDTIPDIMGHILTASLISVPAAITIAKIMVPETAEPTAGDLPPDKETQSAMDAITRGTFQGIELLINVIGMLIVLVALVHLANLLLGLFPTIGGSPLTLERILGFIMAPIVWLMGIPWAEATAAGALMGTKTVLNELLAYIQLSQMPEGTLSSHSMIIMTYAMCGFANPGSLGIMIGGMGTMAPNRKAEIVALGWRSIIAGTLATCMTGTIAGMLT